MANLASALKEEIGRLARKEIRQQTAGTAKTTAQIVRDIAALRRQIEDLQHKLSSLRSQGASEQTAARKPARKKAAAKPKDAKDAKAAPAPARQSRRAGFTPQGLKTERERLGLSADNYGKLVGVSGLSIYNWEQEKARPRESSVAALMAIKGIGKREAAKRIGALAKPKKREKRAAKDEQAESRQSASAAGAEMQS